ncbi:hypothetical protein NVS89_10215 [Ancylobacter sp. MQZ15Z-1]|uniref:Uncharacterized protein n=1 Tax=Ancylobacter mangrovi TaxID=2972472 RepID=A0A9X2T6Y8_9HYPH|nr:hypothetical protein [Ancylobacter mangrovi]MCS0495473.1 hypothetical protein [Ancylobacter mangrovi]
MTGTITLTTTGTTGITAKAARKAGCVSRMAALVLAAAGLLAAPGLVRGAAAQPAATQEVPAAAAGEAARFSMQPVEGGLMKLDTRTGAMSFCSQRAGAWVCQAVPDDRAALEAEIGRLQARIAALEKGRGTTPGVPDIMAPPQQGGAGSSTRPDAPPKVAPPPEDDTKLTEDAQRQLDKAMDMAEHVFRRFLEMVDRFRREHGEGATTPQSAPQGVPPGKSEAL